jgi:hypothetical protein
MITSAISGGIPDNWLEMKMKKDRKTQITSCIINLEYLCSFSNCSTQTPTHQI